MEAAGVELISVLTARKLLILGTATTPKKAPLPDPLYVYCTKWFLLLSRLHLVSAPSIRQVQSKRSDSFDQFAARANEQPTRARSRRSLRVWWHGSAQ